VGYTREGGGDVFARVSTYRGDPALLDPRQDAFPSIVDALVYQVDGFEGDYYSVDRGSGKALTMTLWESEEAMRASEEEANQFRTESAEATPSSTPPWPSEELLSRLL